MGVMLSRGNRLANKRQIRLRGLGLLGLALAASGPLAAWAVDNATSPGVRDRALSPSESTAQLVIADGYQIHLIAAEPDVASPVDAAFDDRGRLWVVEMIDYPFREKSQTEPRGRVRILSDSDADGRFDQARVFADRLDMPTGIGLWRDGAVVTLAGKLVWMRDTDGDDRADKEEVWLEGFAQQNEQLRANHPRLELDGCWYIASGLRGGKVVAASGVSGTAPSEPIELGTRDVRFDPRTGMLEAITGPAQFGLTFDMVGTRMFCSNRNPCVQVVFEQNLLNDNPLTGIVPPIRDVLPSGEASHVKPLVEAWTTSNLHAGQFTAACGVYFQHQAAREAMPEEAIKRISTETLGQVFVCEPTGSLVHMQPVTHRGTLWEVDSKSASQDAAEWLASRDPWFRPVNVLAAPGNGVLVIDMHRAVIEHPDWVPDELKNRPDSRYGEMSGRIYWAATKDAAWPAASLQELREQPLGKRSNAELVKLLDRSDAWIRRTAARLLIERDAVDALPQLLAMAADTHTASVEARVYALQLIALFDPGARTHLKPALTDAQRLVQIAALRTLSRIPVAAADGADHSSAEATQMALELAVATEDPWLRLEAAMCAARNAGALSQEDGQKAAERLGRLAAAHADDAHLLVAIAAATRQHSSRFFLSWLDGLTELPADAAVGRVGQDVARDKWITSAARMLVAHLEKRDSAATGELMARLRFNLTSVDEVSPLSRLAALAALTQRARTLVALDRRQSAAAAAPGGAKAGESKPGEAAAEPSALRAAIDRPLWRKVRELARLPETAPTVRLASVELLGLSPRKSDRELIKALATESEDGTLRNQAIKAWAEQDSPECEEFLVAEVAEAGPALRPTLIELLLAKPERQQRMLAALEAGKLNAKQLGAVELKRFADRAKGDLKAGFEKQLGSILNSDRAAVLRDYMSCLELPGDVSRGKQVFAKQCAACHRIGHIGTQVGPDISDSRVQTAEKLLTSIIDPNRAIDNNYFRFVVLTTDGRTVDGLIAEETADKVVIRGQNDQRHVIPRSEIEQMKATGVSMMPEGLESQIDRQSMADLIAFVKNWRYDSQQIPAGIKAGKK